MNGRDLAEVEAMVENPWFTVEAAGRIAAQVPGLCRHVRKLEGLLRDAVGENCPSHSRFDEGCTTCQAIKVLDS